MRAFRGQVIGAGFALVLFDLFQHRLWIGACGCALIACGMMMGNGDTQAPLDPKAEDEGTIILPDSPRMKRENREPTESH
jgi:hypothetical protein